MSKSPEKTEAESLVEIMRTQTQTRRRLRELHELPRPTDDEREEAWLLLRSIRTLASKARQLRLEETKVRLGALETTPSMRPGQAVSQRTD